MTTGSIGGHQATLEGPQETVAAVPTAARRDGPLACGERIRIAAILDTWIVSGPGRQLAALSNGLAERGADMTIVLFQRKGRPVSPFIAYLDRMGVPYRVIEQSGRFDSEELAKVGTVLTAIDPHIVQSHGYRPTAIVSLLRVRRWRKERPWTWLGYFHGATRQNAVDVGYNMLNDRLLRFADRVVVLSEEHKGWFRRLGDRVRIIHNAALVLPEEKEAVDISHLRAPNRVLIGVVARLSHEKGVDLLVEAIAKLRASGINAALVIAGDGDEKARLDAQISRLGIGPHVHYLGRISAVMGLYPQLDLLVIPSRPGSEGLPNVLLESIRAGTPVVATRVAAVPEVLTDPMAGIVVEPGSPDAIAQGVKIALKLCRGDEAAAARLEVLERFSIERRVERILALYTEVVAEKAGSGRPAARVAAGN
jgi:glycosyltransferase involved in cell wall biosynthesis